MGLSNDLLYQVTSNACTFQHFITHESAAAEGLNMSCYYTIIQLGCKHNQWHIAKTTIATTVKFITSQSLVNQLDAERSVHASVGTRREQRSAGVCIMRMESGGKRVKGGERAGVKGGERAGVKGELTLSGGSCECCRGQVAW